jgi:phage terminase large subunit-like protein
VELAEDGARVLAIPQTFSHLGPPWRELDKIILLHRLRHGGHPILRWMAGNVEVVTDPAGNQRPSKANSSERIDGMVALDIALGRWMAHGEPAMWQSA